MDASRLSKGEQIVGGAGIVLFITSFISLWAKYELGNETERYSAWYSEGGESVYPFYTKLALILALVAVAFVVIRLLGVDLNLPIPLGLLYVADGALISLFMLLTLLVGPKEFDFQGLEESRGIFLYLGVLLSLAMLYGGYLHMQSEGSTPTPTEPPPPAA